MPKALISIIIPTYNSARTLPICLSALQKQTLFKNLEILLIDGNSSDKTRTIGKQFGVTIIDNPKRLPEIAKAIGLQAAKGKYCCFLDSDEELIDNKQLENRLNFFTDFPEIKMITLDYFRPLPQSSTHTLYLNQYGDPFTLFIWGNKEIANSKRYLKLQIKQNSKQKIFSYNQQKMYLVTDGGSTMFVTKLLQEKLKREKNIVSSVAAYLKVYPNFGIISDDCLYHHAHTTLTNYLSKLKFRVINNLHYPQQAGFMARSNHQQQYKALLFIFYCLFFPLPIMDVMILSWQNRRWGFFYHLLYTYYLFFTLIKHVFLKIIGLTPPSPASYGK